jgi:hypothetical protein
MNTQQLNTATFKIVEWPTDGRGNVIPGTEKIVSSCIDAAMVGTGTPGPDSIWVEATATVQPDGSITFSNAKVFANNFDFLGDFAGVCQWEAPLV